MLAAASRHDVWVLTLPESIAPIRAAIDGDPRASRVHLVSIPLSSKSLVLRTLSSWQFHQEYDRWQRRAARVAVELDRRVDFDVVHHVTLASYWTRAGVGAVPKPLVWGPVGGGVDPPIRLLAELGIRGLFEATFRIMGRPGVAILPPMRHTQRSAAVILVQNPETGRRLHASGRMKLLPNALAVRLDELSSPGQRRSADIVVVGRLLPWKAPILALRALRYVSHPGTTLRFFGDGPEQRRLERTAEEWGLDGRVRFEGWVPRRVLLRELAGAGVLLHPSLHDEAPLCVAEALTLGTPVVALDHGGPSQIVGQWRSTLSALITPGSPDVTARRMAAAVEGFLGESPPIGTRPVPSTTSFEDEILDAYELAVGGARPSLGRRSVRRTPA
jgi:glycosyltransferase involved in cell wall biosynthesis